MHKYIFVLIFFALTSELIYANRKVVIPIEKGLKLVNTSSANVTYNLTCKDKNGVPTSEINLTGQTLNAGLTNIAITSGTSTSSKCGDGYIEYALGGDGLPQMKRCEKTSPPTPFANINLACSAFAHVCSLAEVATYKGATNGSDYGAFVSTGTWSYYDGTSWTDYDGNSAYYAMAKFYPAATAKFNNGSQGTGAITFPDGGYATPIANSIYDIFCCSTHSEATQCEVEITSGGHLSSPGFLGGKPF